MALTLLLAPNPPATNSRNGQWLLNLCAAYDGSDASLAKVFPCMSYVAGVTDTIGNYEDVLERTGALDNVIHLNLAAHLGLVPKETIDRLAASPSTAPFASHLSKAQLQVGKTRLAPDLEGVDIGTFVKPVVCFASGVDNGQCALVIVKFLRDHPERLHESAAFLSMEALKTAFPCEKAQTGAAP